MNDTRPPEALRDRLARILHERFMMPGHVYPDAPWKDACSESADQTPMRDLFWFLGILTAFIIMGPVYLALAVWDRLRG